jgi:hypoxanthine-DNA glycosylase
LRAAAASRGFEPIATAAARVLVLGSLPGRVSLERREYYAQPRNAFWRIMGELFGAGPEHGSPLRIRRLQESRIAVWDVCASAQRAGSLDSSIVRASVVVNDFEDFFAAHPHVALIAFNGATAQHLYERMVLPRLPSRWSGITRLRLPSTSPAHAGMSHSRKLEHWSALRDAAGVVRRE